MRIVCPECNGQGCVVESLPLPGFDAHSAYEGNPPDEEVVCDLCRGDGRVEEEDLFAEEQCRHFNISVRREEDRILLSCPDCNEVIDMTPKGEKGTA